MVLAHGGGGSVGGALLVALPLLVLGVVLFFQKTVKPVVSVGLVVTGIAVVVLGMTIFAEDDGAAGASSPGGDQGYVSAVTGLCEARRVASAEPEEAVRLFQDRVHVPLHDIAAQVEEADRAAAAKLLEAKQEVEAEIEEGSLEGEVLEDRLGGLLDATVSGLAATDLVAPTC